MGCGASFHMCKATEHEELCPYLHVPCLNASFGCDKLMQRQDRVRHLKKCPASIVTCSAEWNRWPVFCRNRLKTVPFRQKNPRAEEGQLDFDLALRDQRIIPDLRKMPRRTRLALRNNLTRRHPALPAPSNLRRKSSAKDSNAESLKLTAQFEVSDSEPIRDNISGLAKMFGKDQMKMYKRWQDDVDSAIARTGQPVPKKYWEFEELEKGNIHKHCAYCMQLECDRQEKYYDQEEGWRECCGLKICDWGCGASFHRCKASEHKIICPLYEEEGEFDWICRDRTFKKKKDVAPPLKPIEGLLTGPGESVSKDHLVMSRGKSIPAPPPMPGNLHSGLRFALGVETVTRLQQKPKEMYTFLCGQDLRRDEYEFHVKNVHNDIHGGLNNWMEARCPLACFGCGFAARRMYPGNHPGNKVVFSKINDSFGIRPHQEQGMDERRCDPGLIELPVELLEKIFHYLDSLSLSCVSLVSSGLREIACSLLDMRGCLSLQWERVDKEGDGVQWAVAYKRWFYSCGFDPVTRWGHNTDAKVANHLKTCPYNLKTEHKPWPKHEQKVKDFMEALERKIELKKNSEWFIP